MIILNMIQCKKCGDIIESVTVHDFKTCSCGECSVDGGHDYLRRCAEDWDDYRTERNSRRCTGSHRTMTLHNKYMMTVEQNLYVAKRNLVDYIWKSTCLEGRKTTFHQAQSVCDGSVINGLLRDDVITVNNLKHAWQLVFERVDRPIDITYICRLNQVVGSNLICDSGYLRKVPVRMGGTSWVPDMPVESQIKEELRDSMDISAATDRAITLMLWSMRRQMFPDGNKRTSMLAANQVMIQNGCGVISVPIEKQDRFKELLVRFYETNDMSMLKAFVYDDCIDGVDFPKEQERRPLDDESKFKNYKKKQDRSR